MVYDNVKSVCEKQGKSIAALEREAEIGNGTIGKWKTSTPNLATLEKVANVLKIPVTKLMK